MIQVQFQKCEGTLCSGETLTSNSVGIEVQFNFSDDWDGLTKLCVFRSGSQTVDVLLEGERCRIPPELLRQADRRLLLAVRGADAQGELVLSSTYVCLGLVQEGALPGGEEAEQYTPSLADRILGRAGEAVQAAASAEAARRSAENSAALAQASADRLLLSRYDALLEAALLWDSRTGNPVLLQDAAAGIPLKSLRLETGYCSDGIRQIAIRRTGKNIWNSERFLKAAGWSRTEDGGYTGRASKLRARFQDSVGGMFGGDLDWDRQVTLSFEVTTEHESGNRLTVYIAYADGSSASTTGSINGTARTRYTLTSRPGSRIRCIFFSYGSDTTLCFYNFQVEFGAEATAFEPYREEIETAVLQETVYGGTLELTEGRFTPRYDAEGQEIEGTELALSPRELLLPQGDTVLFADAGSLTATYCRNAALTVARLLRG